MDESISKDRDDTKKRLKIGEFLLVSGMINQRTLDHALNLQKTQKKKLGQILVELGVIDDVVIAKALSYQLRIPCVRLKNLPISPEVLAWVPASVAEQNLLIPTQLKDKKLVLAMANPLEQSRIDALQRRIKMPLEITVAPERDIREAISNYYTESLRAAEAGFSAVAGVENENGRPTATPPSESPAPREDSEDREAVTILVVDDNDMVLKTMAKILHTEGYGVATAQNGTEALESVSRYKPDMVITDYLMPEMDGIALIRHLRSREDTRCTPIIMLTVKEEVDAEVRVIEAGADDYLTKPVSRKRLVARVNRMVQRLRAEGGSR